MSAFAGVVSFDPAGVPPDIEEHLRRGLTGQLAAEPRSYRTPKSVFVFRQRILSPEDRFEQQPSVGGAGRILSMFDGRLDNRAELLASLGLRSPPEAPVPDGDLVRMAYERWEEEAVPRLLGDFAWAVWNGSGGRLMLARDHGQQRSLYFSRVGAFVAFATGYGPLLALPQIPRDFDDVAIADTLLRCNRDDDSSFYNAISRVHPAGRVVATGDGLRHERVWEPHPRPTLRLSSDAEYVEAARAVVEEAVACRQRVAGPLVVSVSGGLDSSGIAATLARRAAPAPVHGLCIVPAAGAPVSLGPTQYASERPFVEALSSRWPNLSVEFLEPGEVEPFELDPTALFVQHGAPLRETPNLAWFMGMYRRAAQIGATTVLHGGFGNLTLSADGYDWLSALRERGAWGSWLFELAALRRAEPHRWAHLFRYHVKATLPPGVSARLKRLYRGIEPDWKRIGAVNPDFAQAAGLDERFGRLSLMHVDPWGAGGRVRGLREMLLNGRLGMEAVAARRTLVGVSSSNPLADRRLIDFCLSLPGDQFLKAGQARSLARRVFADRLPSKILENTRRGAQGCDWHARYTPHRDAMMAELALLEGSPLASRSLDLPRLRRILDGWPRDAGQVRGGGLPNFSVLRTALHVGQFLRWVEAGGGGKGGQA